MKKIIATIIFLCAALFQCGAQDSYAQSRFKEGAKSARSRFAEISAKNKEKFAAYHDAVWEKFGAKSPISLPDDWKMKPIPYDNKPITTKDIPIEEIIDPIVEEPIAGPSIDTPVVPEIELPDAENVQIDFYGTALKIHAPSNGKINLSSLDGKAISATLSYYDNVFSSTVQQCLSLRNEYNLCDWAYATMLFKFSQKYYGPGNEATLLMAYLYMSSGYKMILGKVENTLCLLFASESYLFGRNYYEIGNNQYYIWGDVSSDSIEIIKLESPDAANMKMNIRALPRLENKPTNERQLKSKVGHISTAVSVNSNLIEFYNDYPRFFNSPDILTRWAIYANTPVEKSVRTILYPDLKAQIAGMDRTQGLQELLYFVQTSFDYKLDDEVWGEDRPFFAEESLYYDYCDCEDRSILFSHLVRDLLGMKVILVYYPGHLATAVKVDEDIPGDYLSMSDGDYIICDPTYIGAPIGATMPDMDNNKAKVILLKE